MLTQALITCALQKFFRHGYILKLIMFFKDAIIDKSDSNLFIEEIRRTMGEKKMGCCLMCIDCFGCPCQGIGRFKAGDTVRIVSPSTINFGSVSGFYCFRQPAGLYPKLSIGQALAVRSVEAATRLGTGGGVTTTTTTTTSSAGSQQEDEGQCQEGNALLAPGHVLVGERYYELL